MKTLEEMLGRDIDDYKKELEKLVYDQCCLNELCCEEEQLRLSDLSAMHSCHSIFSSSIFSHSDLSYSLLNNSDFSDCDLSHVNFTGASLKGCNFSRAYLVNASLQDVTLDSTTNFTGAWMPHGERWEEYLSEVVPYLLTATGKSIREVLDTNCWNCHQWTNCPIHVVFNINFPSEAPVIFQSRVREFVSFFDAGLIPKPYI